jgi:hypothetical protein
MKHSMLNQLVHGPQTLEELSDALWWDHELTKMVIGCLIFDGSIHAEIDGTYWMAREAA